MDTPQTDCSQLVKFAMLDDVLATAVSFARDGAPALTDVAGAARDSVGG